LSPAAVLQADSTSHLEAEQHAMSLEMRSDLMVCETADGPIWNGQDEIVVRKALPDERARWREEAAECAPDGFCGSAPRGCEPRAEQAVANEWMESESRAWVKMARVLEGSPAHDLNRRMGCQV
jgi:hypothetical protein